MSKVKTAREEWVEAFIAASVELSPRIEYGEDIVEHAYELHEKHSRESAAEVAARRHDGGTRRND